MPPPPAPRQGARDLPARAGGGPAGWLHRLRILAVVASALTVVAAGGTYVAAHHYAGFVQHFKGDLFGPDQQRPAEGADSAENFLLVGSDSRNGLTWAERKRYHLGRDVGRRSDTMIILHISQRHDRATLVSLPRDSYVQIPAHTDAQGRHIPASYNKLNAAYSFGGPKLTIATVEHATGVRIDHYVEISVVDFARMVDALGGIDVCLSKPANDPKSGLHLPAGHSHVGGVQGLAFVRARKTLGDGSDLGRIKRQQQFLGAMLRKALSLGLLLDPPKLDKFLTTALSAVHVDKGLTFDGLRDLALAMRHLDPKHVAFVTVPLSDTDYRPGTIGSTVRWDEGLSHQLFQALRTDDEINPAAVKAHKPTVPPAQVSVQVLNGTGQAGLAGRVAGELSAQGFHLAGQPSNADKSDYGTTVIRYAAAQQQAAQTVKAAFPDATLQQDPSAGSTVVVVLGSSFSSVSQVQVSSSTPAPKIPTSTAGDNPCASS